MPEIKYFWPRNGLLIAVSTVMAAVLSVSCTPVRDANSSRSVWLPWPQPDGQYRVQKVAVETVTEWSPLRGSAVDIRSHPQWLDKNHLRSQEVLLEHTQDSSGAIIPATRFSTEVAAIYANFERLQKLDRELVLPEADRTRKVYVAYQINLQGGVGKLNNAEYNAMSDSFFVVPYNMGQLPLSVNGGVLAHEHFHSIFARLLLRPLLQRGNGTKAPVGAQLTADFSPHSAEMVKAVMKPFQLKPSGLNDTKNKIEPESVATSKRPAANKSQYLNFIALTALNEGLADIWGWFYSGDPCFIERSIRHRLATKRCLNLELETITLKTLTSFAPKLKASWSIEEQNEQARADGYELGTNLARLFYQRLRERGEFEKPEAIKGWEKRIVEVLPTFLPHFTKVFIDDNMTSSEVQWERLVDTVLFGPGSASIPDGKCESWLKTMKVEQDLENIKAKCKK